MPLLAATGGITAKLGLEKIDIFPHCAMLYILALLEEINGLFRTDKRYRNRPVSHIFSFYLSEVEDSKTFQKLIQYIPQFYSWATIGAVMIHDSDENPQSTRTPRLPLVAKESDKSSESQRPENLKAPSSNFAKELISAYQKAATLEERQKIIVPLLITLCNIPLIFLVLYDVIQKPAEEFRNSPFGAIASIPEGADTVPMAKRIIRPIELESGRNIVPVFTDYETYNQSEYPQYLNKVFMEAYECRPDGYLPLLKDLQYDGVLINHGTQNHFFTKDFFEMFMAKGITLSEVKKKNQRRIVSSEDQDEKCSGLNRTLPIHCKWVVYKDTIKRYSINEYEEDNGLTSIEKKLYSIQIEYLYKDGWMNPWLQNAVFELYLKANGLPGVQGTYKGNKYEIVACGIPEYCSFDPRIRLYSYSEDEEVFIKLAEIVEWYCINGYRPEEKVLAEMLVQYTPTKIIESEEWYSGYHDENNISYSFSNAQNIVIAHATRRTYDSSDCKQLCEFLRENKGEMQVFGLSSTKKDTSTPEE